MKRVGGSDERRHGGGVTERLIIVVGERAFGALGRARGET